MSEAFDSWHSYPSLFPIGHRALNELLLNPVLVEEKIDGSQFSFGVFGGHQGEGYVVKCRSKSVQLNLVAPEKMFLPAVEQVQRLAPMLRVGWTYRAEYLKVPKHNSLAYDRIPQHHLMVFDINPNQENYLSYDEKKAECDRLGLECVPLIYDGMVESPAQFRAMLDRTSVLGGQKIEGVVVKNYWRFGPDKKVLMGKFVSEAFKEVHAAEWKVSNPGKADVVQALIETLKTPARWNKAVQHLREAGKIDDSPKDIGLLFPEVHADIDKECIELIAEKLVQWALPQIKRGVCAGLPEWYKDKLVERQFEKHDD